MRDAIVTVLCIGKFDALHRGHRALAERATASGQPVALLRFSGMAEVLGWEPRVALVAECDRARILATWPGSPAEVDLPFALIRGLDAAGFLALARERFATTALVVGEDFRGGRGRTADVAAFTAAGVACGVSVVAVPAVSDATGAVSSTRVRTLLAAGDVAGAALLLGRPQRVVGTVVRGDGRGRGIGIPTANLGERLNQAPAAGVYAAWAWLGERRVPAAVNIGVVPTAGDNRPATVEAHLIGWSGDCYGQRLDLEFIKRLRDERRFPDFTTLVAQIRADVADAAQVLGFRPTVVA